MDKIDKKSLGFTVPVLVYASEAEADKDAGRVGAFREEANNNLYYRSGCAQEAREIIAEAVEKATGIERTTRPVTRKAKQSDGSEKIETVKDKEGNEVVEFVDSEEEFVKTALAKSGKTVEMLQATITAAIVAANEKQGIRVDIRKQERKPTQPKVLPERFLVAAKGAISNGKVNNFARDYEKLLKKPLASTTDAVAVGWALKEFIAAREAVALAGLGV